MRSTIRDDETVPMRRDAGRVRPQTRGASPGRFGQVLFATVVWGLAWASLHAALPEAIGIIRGGITIPVQDEQGQIRTLLTGKEMRRSPSGQMLITQFRMTNREPALIVEAPECQVAPGSYDATSAGLLTAKTPDGQFSIQGTGFLWQHRTGRLIISNAVELVLQPSLMTRSKESPAASPPLHVKAGRFDYDAKATEAVCSGAVQVIDPEWRLTCERLRARLRLDQVSLNEVDAEQDVKILLQSPLGQLEAESQKASYRATEAGVDLDLSGDPRWSAPPYSGRGERLSLRTRADSTTIAAEGRSVLQLPRPWAPGLAAAEPVANAPAELKAMMTLRADRYELGKGRVQFTGNVEAVDPNGQIRSERMVVGLSSSNTVEKITAQEKVRMALGGATNRVEASGEEAVLAIDANGLTAELRGQPRWRTAQFEGAAQSLSFRYAAPAYEVRAKEQAELRIARSVLGQFQLFRLGSPTNAAAAREVEANGPVALNCEDYVLLPTEARFTGGVTVTNLPGRLACADLVAEFTTNRELTRLRAEREVRLEQPGIQLSCVRLTADADTTTHSITRARADGEVALIASRDARQVHAKGDRMTYEAAQNLVLLEGTPVVDSGGVHLAGADQIRWNLTTGRLGAVGAYAVQGPAALLQQAKPLLPDTKSLLRK